MSIKENILIVDNLGAVSSNIAFLLQLSGFDVNVFADELEACNWLLQTDRDQFLPRMLLLNEPRAERSLFSLLFQMRQKFSRLELLFSASRPLQLTGQILNLDPPVHQCLPGEIHSMTRKIFHRSVNRSFVNNMTQDNLEPLDSGLCRNEPGKTQTGME